MKYIFLHGLGQAPSDWETTIKRLDLGLDVDCPDLSDWLSGKEARYFNLYHALAISRLLMFCSRENTVY